MIRSRTTTPKSEDDGFDASSKSRFRVIKDPSSASEVGSLDTEPQEGKDSERRGVSKDTSSISADTPVSIVFESSPKLTKSSLRRQNEALGGLSEEDAERFRLLAYSASPVSSQIPELGWCCDHFGSITSVVSAIGSFAAGTGLLLFMEDTHLVITMIAGFFLFLGCILLAWSVREIVMLYARKKFFREQRERLSQATSQASTSRHTVQLSHTASQTSATRHTEETELSVIAPITEKLPGGQDPSQPSTSRQFSELECTSRPTKDPVVSPEFSSTSTPSEPPKDPVVSPEFPESTVKPTSSKGKYPPKGDYRKVRREYYIETDI